MVVSTPEIIEFKLSKDHDFIVLASRWWRGNLSRRWDI